MQASLRRSLRYAFSLALAVAILAVLLGRQDWGEFARRIRSVRWPLLLATVALAVLRVAFIDRNDPLSGSIRVLLTVSSRLVTVTLPQTTASTLAMTVC